MTLNSYFTLNSGWLFRAKFFGVNAFSCLLTLLLQIVPSRVA